ncbi:MAG: cytochrome C [Desulfuromonadales bacterium]|nr:cytochrome C [Desulfuromonadales bacterium]NIS43710.1 cytochrome C [Desulfuromonadales bacterium]
MNYPVWYLPSIGGGTLIALIAVTHVFVSHFAVGGGLYLVLTERKARREGSAELLEFVRRHAKFFLILTLVFGSLSGVGIWFVIALVQPAGTSLLIHNFVFGWATEWVFFLVEIVAITIYYYAFERMEARTHMTVGWIYFGFAWLSLFIINGIITFMLTPGGWSETGNFWAGFLNPTFWPSLVFRTFIALALAGVFAFLTTAFSKSGEIKRRMTRYSGWWALAPLAASLPAGWWYVKSLPPKAQKMVEGANPVIQAALDHGGYALAALALLVVVFALVLPRFHNKVLAVVMLSLALASMGAFEWTRENARRPYVVNGGDGVLYSSGIWVGEMERIDKAGFLGSARWTAQKDVHEESLVEAGEEIFKFQCYACHTVGGLNNDILPLTAQMDSETMRGYLERIHEIRYFMPPFAGTDEEARALSAFIVKGLHGKEAPKAGQEGESGTDADKEKGADAGEDVFENNCAMCHTLTGGSNPLLPKVEGWSRGRIRDALDKLTELNPAMPPLQASKREKDQLADFLVSQIQGGRS